MIEQDTAYLLTVETNFPSFQGEESTKDETNLPWVTSTCLLNYLEAAIKITFDSSRSKSLCGLRLFVTQIGTLSEFWVTQEERGKSVNQTQPPEQSWRKQFWGIEANLMGKDRRTGLRCTINARTPVTQVKKKLPTGYTGGYTSEKCKSHTLGRRMRL
ncbi:hypothetical protein B0H16DRAFT_1476482 [Mycena metata]|uniref:Uncharacterized protein n=1 Tax=Mycena metata TaxID=1033252 RepID=A0AAD7MGV0_9AGAR|nr:hypothetical protein B0H16DRAFT_1476482 [Mycena metata]